MNIGPLLHVGFALLAALSTLLLGMGERDLRLAMLVAILSAASIYFTDRRRWLVLTPRAANLTGLGAVGLALWDWLGRYQTDSQLLALANLLVYLQCVLLFQSKNIGTYWQLLVLGLMQVAVAAALNLSPIFGLLLLLYLGLGLVCLSLLFLHREAVRACATLDASSAAGLLANHRLASRPIRESEFHAASAPRLETLLRADYWGQIARIALGTLALTGLFFLAVPRVGSARWQTGGTTRQYEVGVTESITLGESGRVFENPEGVLRIEFFDNRTGERYVTKGEVYLRGSTLVHYSQGTWKRATGSDDSVLPLPSSDRDAFLWHPELVLQRITIEPLETDSLYAVYPILNPHFDRAILYDSGARLLLRPRSLVSSQLTYELVTPAFREGLQQMLLPADGDRRLREIDAISSLPRDQGLEGLRRLAEQIVRDIPADRPLDRAWALEKHLRYTGQFRYSLDLEVSDPRLDPIEDFVLNTKSGHCEYFASALALMCRAVGIPARIVLGFRGGDWNPFGSFYQVRQLHTHAWVEAYFPREALPTLLPPPARQWNNGAWLRLDATPGDERNAGQAGPSQTVVTYRQAVDFVRFLWSNYVLGMDAQRQQTAIYRPLAQSAKQLAANLRDPEWWRLLAHRLFWFLRTERGGWFGGEWFSWRAGLAASMISLVVALSLRWLGPPLARWALRRWSVRSDSIEQDEQTVAFQRRLEHVLATLDLSRSASQTQREFADAAQSRLALRPATADVAGVPPAVARAFYRVRFGGESLDKAEREAVEHSLDRLERALLESETDEASRHGA